MWIGKGQRLQATGISQQNVYHFTRRILSRRYKPHPISSPPRRRKPHNAEYPSTQPPPFSVLHKPCIVKQNNPFHPRKCHLSDTYGSLSPLTQTTHHRPANCTTARRCLYHVAPSSCRFKMTVGSKTKTPEKNQTLPYTTRRTSLIFLPNKKFKLGTSMVKRE